MKFEMKGMRTKLRFEDNQRDSSVCLSVDSLIISQDTHPADPSSVIPCLDRIMSSPFEVVMDEASYGVDLDDQQFVHIEQKSSEKDLYVNVVMSTGLEYDADFDEIVETSDTRVFCVIN